MADRKHDSGTFQIPMATTAFSCPLCMCVSEVTVFVCDTKFEHECPACLRTNEILVRTELREAN